MTKVIIMAVAAMIKMGLAGSFLAKLYKKQNRNSLP